jgi:hypothetical protein
VNVLQIDAERGKDDLPVITFRIGDNLNATVEVLRPKRSRWHWWLDRRRHTTEHTIMSPLFALTARWWDEDRGNDFVSSTVVVPKAALARLRRTLHRNR